MRTVPELKAALRTDGHGWRQLRASDPPTAELRILCRDQIGLIEQRTALVLQLKAALHEYYPVALYRKRIGELFNNHPDRDCFGSLPGAGEKLAPRLLAELG